MRDFTAEGATQPEQAAIWTCQTRKDIDIQGLRQAISNQARKHHPATLSQDDRKGLNRGRIHAFIDGQRQNNADQQDRRHQRNKAKADELVRRLTPIKLRNRAGGDDQQQEGENPSFNGQGAERRLLCPQNPRNADHAAVED